MDEDSIARRLTAIESSIGDLRSGISANSLNDIRNAVTETTRLQKAIQSELDSLRKQFLDYIVENRSRQSAEVAVLDAKAKLDREFGHYQAVRRSAAAMLRALDAGLVTPARLQEEAERLMLDAPGYWLTPALVAVFAWISGSEAVANRGKAEATRLDAGKSALFFSLMAARYGRHHAAEQWLCQHLRSLDSSSLTAGFSPLMDAAGEGDLGAPARDRLIAVCTGWRDHLRRDSQLADEQVERWQTFTRSKRKRLNGEFDLLPEITVGRRWEENLDQLEASATFGEMKNWLDEQLSPEGPRDVDTTTLIDALLGSLIAEPDKDEESLLEHVGELRAAAGNHDNNAKATAGPSGGRPAKRDFLTLLTDMALRTHKGTPPTRVPLFILALSGPFIKDAVRGLRHRNERGKPDAIDIDIDGWRRGVLYNDVDEGLAQEFADFIESEMGKKLNSPIARLPGRREAILEQWRERATKGRDNIQRAVGDVHKFYREWNIGEKGAKDCIELIDHNFVMGASSSDPSLNEYRTAHLAPGQLPEWDLLPPT